MTKSKLGISIPLLGAAVCFLGLFSTLGALLLAGYILIREDDQLLRKNAVKVIAFIIAIQIGFAAIALLSSASGTINQLLYLVKSDSAGFNIRVDNIFSSILRIIEILILVSMGLKALNGKDVSPPLVNSLVETHMA